MYVLVGYGDFMVRIKIFMQGKAYFRNKNPS